jgi:HD-GYP domain-containing protein (c-di-GMP phosphodiesterase class II)
MSDSRVDDALHNSMQLHHAATSTHCARVGRMSGVIARRLGLSDAEIHALTRAARLHDIGKIDVPGHLLIKTGRLTDDERALMDRHPALGVARIARLIDDPTMIAVIGSHHERWDGSGYPRGLAGTQISLAARIVAVADVYDALREHRPYKPAWSHAKAVAHLVAAGGTLFDPAVVAAFAMTRHGAANPIIRIYTGYTYAPEARGSAAFRGGLRHIRH